MPLVRIASFTVSADGFGAGTNQSLEHPLGEGGEQLHGWFVGTRTFNRALGRGDDGRTDADDRFAARGFENVGAWILGRNMFGPVRGPWPDESWRGWWGDTPPYHVPVFVLTHHARRPLEMEGGTTFHFVTDGIDSALAQARAAAGDRDVRIGGGVSTLRQYLLAGAVDEVHLALSPVFLGRGERLFDGVNLPALGFEMAEAEATEHATHMLLRRNS